MSAKTSTETTTGRQPTDESDGDDDSDDALEVDGRRAKSCDDIDDNRRLNERQNDHNSDDHCDDTVVRGVEANAQRCDDNNDDSVADDSREAEIVVRNDGSVHR